MRLQKYLAEAGLGSRRACEALIRAVSKDADEGIVFVGANAWRVDHMMHVRELMNELITGTEEALKEN